MTVRKIALVVIAMPAMFAFAGALAFHARVRNNGFVITSGERREYLLHVPRTYDRTKPAPLVISMHGAGGWPEQQMDISRWNRMADRHGFIVVYPAGAVRGGPRVWRVERSADLGRDVRFISDLTDRLETTYNIDRRRIYADGLSNGGGMAFVLSCTLSGRIAAVGLISSAQTLPFRWCTDSRPVPMIAFHGTNDRIIPYNGGVSFSSSESFPNIPRWAEKWAKRNRCTAQPIDTAIAPDVIRREYAHCAKDASVVLYTIRGGGHTWPGGEPLPEWLVGPTSNEIDATAESWAFFRAHPLEQIGDVHEVSHRVDGSR